MEISRRLGERYIISWFFPLGSVPSRIDSKPLAWHPVQHDVRSPADDQLSDFGLGSGPTQMGMSFESFNYRDNADAQPLGCARIVEGRVSVDFAIPFLSMDTL